MGMEHAPGFYWVRAKAHGPLYLDASMPQPAYCEGDGTWWVLGWDAPVNEEDLPWVGPRVAGPA